MKEEGLTDADADADGGGAREWKKMSLVVVARF